MPRQTGSAPNPNQPLTRRAFASLVNRFQGPEKIADLAWAPGATLFLPRPIPLSRPLESLKVIWRGRLVVGVADYTAAAAESPQTVISRIRVRGTHASFNQLTPIDMSGATIFAWHRLFQSRGNAAYINGTLQPALGVPLAQTVANLGAQATYDLEVHYSIPFAPVLGPAGRSSLVPFMLQPDDWQDSLQLEIVCGDRTSFGTPAGGTTTVFTAFGSAAGSPSIGVYGNYAILGPLAGRVNGVVTIRSEQPSAGAVTALANGVQLINLQKQRTTNVVAKSGTQLAGAPDGVFAAMSDVQLSRTQIIADNKPIRNTSDNFASKDYCARMFDTTIPQGYFPLTFVDSHNPLTMLRGDLVPGGSSFILQSDVLTAGATQTTRIVQEMVYGAARAK
jgi:hypothetical protein